MNIEFNGKTAVVTGATGGIGYICARTLLESGAKVAIIGTNQETLDSTAASLAGFGTVKGFVADVSSVSAISPLVSRIRAELGEIEILVQAAGLMRGKPGIDVTEEDWDQMLNVNARGLFFMMQQVVAQSMIKTGGSIINVSSMAGIRGMHPPMCSAHYSASKGAVVALTLQSAVEWASCGIRVNAVAPGGVLTPAMEKMGFPPEAVEPVPLKRMSSPQDIANAITFLASDKAAMITGQVLVVDGGSSAVGY